METALFIFIIGLPPKVADERWVDNRKLGPKRGQRFLTVIFRLTGDYPARNFVVERTHLRVRGVRELEQCATTFIIGHSGVGAESVTVKRLKISLEARAENFGRLCGPGVALEFQSQTVGAGQSAGGIKPAVRDLSVKEVIGLLIRRVETELLPILRSGCIPIRNPKRTFRPVLE
jgi:hypothetical protein